MEIKEMIKVMQHFADGGEVECTEVDFDVWKVVNHPCWNWYYYIYRIKEPTPKVTIEKWLCQDRQNVYTVVETSNIEKYTLYKKVKLIKSYEVEL